jgi:hypothetical protein
MVTDATPETFQLRVELPPRLMLEGLAVKERITGNEVGGGEVGGGEVGGGEVGGGEVGGDGVVTVTVTNWETVPAALVAVRV